MKLPARNRIPGTITSVRPGATTTQVTVEVTSTMTTAASIGNEAAPELGLKPGLPAYPVIKTSDVMAGV